MHLDGVFIDGSWRPTTAQFRVTDPGMTDTTVALVGAASSEDADDAFDAAQRAASSWAATPPADRSDLLFRAAARLEVDADAKAQYLVREEGKILEDARQEIHRSAAILRFFAGEAVQPIGDLLPPQRATSLSYTRRFPIGPVSVITPFNYPVLVPTWKIAAALAFGNPIVWKPAKSTPISAIHLTQAFEDAGVPRGVVNLLQGSGSTLGDVMTKHPAIRGITFTGSTEVGRLIERTAGGTGIKVQTEMGGKNAAIVLDDVDPEGVAATLVKGAMSGAGQKCTAISRAIVMESVAADLIEAIREELARWPVGHGLDPMTKMGPLIDHHSLERVLTEVAHARSEGASVVAGGSSATTDTMDGHYVHPTLITDVTPNMRIATDEVFGPVLAVITVGSPDEALAVANDTRYGLNAAVFSRDLDAVMSVLSRIEAGMVHVNAVSGFPPYAPFGGIKDSGSGAREMGKEAVDFFTESQTVNIHMAGR